MIHLGAILVLADPSSQCHTQPDSASSDNFSLSYQLFDDLDLFAISNFIISLPCAVDMIHKLDYVLPKNVGHLQCGKVSSLKRGYRQSCSGEKGRFSEITLSCALKKVTFPVASAQLFGTLASSSGNHEEPNGFLILSMLPDTARSLAVGPTSLMRFKRSCQY